MIDSKVSLNTWHKLADILRDKETIAKFRIFDIAYRERFHDLFRMFLDKVKSDCVDEVYNIQRCS